MIATGIIRRVDDLGRIVIPKTIRQELNIEEGEPLEIYFDRHNKQVIFQKYSVDENALLNEIIRDFEQLSDKARETILQELKFNY